MKIATVIGSLEPTRRAPGTEQVRWVQVRTDEEILTAADPVGVQPGELVLVATGAGAGHYRMDFRTDALIVAVLEENGNNG